MKFTIDGPCAAGKTSIAKALAEKYHFMYLDTGAIFRALAVFVLENNLEHSIQKLEANYNAGLAQSIASQMAAAITMSQESNGQTVNQIMLMNGVNINDKLRTAETTAMSSRIAVFQPVRDVALKITKDGAKTCPNIIAEGRDTGSVTFPDAERKFFLTADRTERVKRRMLENPSEFPDYKAATEAMCIRDDRDSNRAISPLKYMPDMIYIDSTSMSFDAVMNHISAEIEGLTDV